MFIDESRTASKSTNGAAAGRGAPTEILIHHWGVDGQTHDGVVSFFERASTGTSAHFVVSAGRIHCIVSTSDVAWHAGDWAVNLRSIGIECRPEATDADYTAVAWLINHLRSMYGDIPLRPHNRYAQTACPGRYDLARLDRESRGKNGAPLSGSITPITSEEEELKPEQDAALGVIFNKVNQSTAAGQLASQGDINILLSRLGNVEKLILQAIGAKPAKEPSATLVKGDKEPTVYAWDGGAGYRALGYDEFSALMSTGATLETIPQDKINAAVTK